LPRLDAPKAVPGQNRHGGLDYNPYERDRLEDKRRNEPDAASAREAERPRRPIEPPACLAYLLTPSAASAVGRRTPRGYRLHRQQCAVDVEKLNTLVNRELTFVWSFAFRSDSARRRCRWAILAAVAGSGASTTIRERNRRVFGSPFGAVYDFYIQREPLSRLIARLVWHSDVRPFYASMAALSGMPDGSTIVDAPCGSGVALRALGEGQRVRYLGYDLSPEMLRRAGQRANKLGLDQVELAEADVESLPLEDGSVDLFLSYFGLHCLPDPAAAVREAARCLRPGGRLVGSTIVRGTRPLDRLRVRPGTGAYGPVGTAANLRQWLAGAGLLEITLDVRGVFAYFDAHIPG
jgi:SAM-dependent methyltransferase